MELCAAVRCFAVVVDGWMNFFDPTHFDRTQHNWFSTFWFAVCVFWTRARSLCLSLPFSLSLIALSATIFGWCVGYVAFFVPFRILFFGSRLFSSIWKNNNNTSKLFHFRNFPNLYLHRQFGGAHIPLFADRILIFVLVICVCMCGCASSVDRRFLCI